MQLTFSVIGSPYPCFATHDAQLCELLWLVAAVPLVAADASCDPCFVTLSLDQSMATGSRHQHHVNAFAPLALQSWYNL